VCHPCRAVRGIDIPQQLLAHPRDLLDRQVEPCQLRAHRRALPSVTQPAASTVVRSATASSAISSTARAGTISRPRIRTAGNSPAAIAR
jgi:hypothetical protein